jgi:hypothetical protein
MSEEFFHISLTVESSVTYVMSAITIIVATTSLFVAIRHQSKSNLSVIVLDVLLMINSILQIVVITDKGETWLFHCVYIGAY